MIHARDWRIFLENGVSLQELPVPDEHLPYCLRWLQKHDNVIKEAVVKEKAVIDFENVDFSNYPPCRYLRKDIWVGYVGEGPVFSLPS